MKAKLIIAGLFLLSIISLNAQNPKKLIKTGKEQAKLGQNEEAIKSFSDAIGLDSSISEAYSLRAVSYELTGKKLESANDYKKAFELNPKLPTLASNSGRLFIELGYYKEALTLLTKAAELDKKSAEILNYKSFAQIKLEKFNDALVDANKSLDLKKTALGYYYHGLASVGLNNLETAEMDFFNAIEIESTNEIFHLDLIRTQIKLNKSDIAHTSVDKAIELFPKSIDVYLLRASIHHDKGALSDAINDLSTILTNIEPKNVDVYLLRGDYYSEFKQFSNAIADYSKAIEIDPANIKAYYNRALSNEELKNTPAATSDYKSFIALATTDTSCTQKIKLAKERIYELNRETDKPEIVINSPVQKKSTELEVPLTATKVELSGVINDKSKLLYLKINNTEYTLPDSETVTNEFVYELKLGDLDKITISASDIYNNVITNTYAIVRTEVNAPKIHLLNPYASDDGEVYLSSDDPTLLVEGKITDESLIKSIFVDDATASYKLDEANPSFTASIKITNKNSMTVKVEDIYGNITETRYTFNREGIKAFADNPMGKTWIIFIENSKYESFASLDGPPKDINTMKAALANYKINNIIHKKNMSKAEIEKFFAIELRDLVRDNQVNSLVVWYSGHGKFIHETGYWIPVDAKSNDEFTYFNINSLRASMQSYAKFVIHTLVITDACESGPSFYMAMRSEPKERDCGDWTATRFKSSQVFTSAGLELASDNSKFTQTFANSLNYNPNDCIPIENIVVKVTEAMNSGTGQKPKFGKIAGLEDEDGTFFFVKNAPQ